MKDELNWNPKKNFGLRKWLGLPFRPVGIFVGRGNHPTNQSTNQPTTLPKCLFFDQFRFVSKHWQPRFLPPLTAKPLKKTRPRQKKNSYLKIFFLNFKLELYRKQIISGFHPRQPQTSPQDNGNLCLQICVNCHLSPTFASYSLS